MAYVYAVPKNGHSMGDIHVGKGSSLELVNL